MDICSQILPTNVTYRVCYTEDRYSSHHVHSPQFAGVSCTNATNRGRFGDSLYQLDEEVAAIMAGIVSTSQEANTLTVFTSESVAMPHDCALPLPFYIFKRVRWFFVCRCSNGPSLRNQIRGGNAGLLRCGTGTLLPSHRAGGGRPPPPPRGGRPRARGGGGGGGAGGRAGGPRGGRPPPPRAGGGRPPPRPTTRLGQARARTNLKWRVESGRERKHSTTLIHSRRAPGGLGRVRARRAT